jgi:phosphotransacetylase/acyl dehydratase
VALETLVAEDHLIENRTFDELKIGDTASMVHQLTRSDIELFAVMSGDVNPAHLDERFAARTLFHHVVGHGMLSGALISAVLGTKLPGPGSIYLSQDLHFMHPVGIGDRITVSVTVREKRPEKHVVVLDCRAVSQQGEQKSEVVVGTAEVKAPTEKIRILPAELPEVQLRHHDRYRELMDYCKNLEPVTTAIVHPCDGPSLAGACEAATAGLIVPVLVGPDKKIRAQAEASGLEVSRYRVVSTAHSHAAASEAVNLVRSGEVRAIMKGSLHTDELMHEIVARGSGLRTARRISHVFVLDVPAYSKPLLLTDAVVNISPTLPDKRDICQNAIDLARLFRIEEPKVAILSAVETVSEKLPSTLDAAALCKMADRGQITGGVVDGPLAFDNAINPEAARTKGIVSRVAGQADILVVRDLEEGNLLAKQLTFFAGADSAGIVVGARVPIMVTSRADGLRSRLASCAVALLIAESSRRAAAKVVAD